VSGTPFAKRARRAVRSALIRAAVRLLALLPLRPLSALGRGLGDLAWVLARRTRRLALEHLAMAFPGMPESERRRIGRASFVHFARAAMEAVAVGSIDPRLLDYVRIAGDGERRMEEALAGGRGFVFVTGHLGNWELLARRLARVRGLQATVIAKRSWDERIDAMIESFRASGGVGTLWREDRSGGRALLKAFRDNSALGILIDQDTRVQGVFVPFFGREAWTPRAAADLAIRFRCPVFVGWSHRRGPGPWDGYEIRLEAVAFDADAPDRDAEAKRITALCTARLEEAIRQVPAEWVWMHERWKRRPPGEAERVPSKPDAQKP